MAEIILVIGGSGSGKSEFAEDLLKDEVGKKYYIATMRAFGQMDYKKIEKHKTLRKDKRFVTLEMDKNFDTNKIEMKSSVIIECMGTFCANWLFDEGYEKAVTAIKSQMERVFRVASKVIVVSNDVFSDDGLYPKETKEYLRLFGDVNLWLSAKADKIIEVVYSIPVYHKGGSHD